MKKCCYSAELDGSNTKKKILNKLSRVEGQIRGIKKMIESEEYCDGVMNQLVASRNALISISKDMFEVHLRCCIMQQSESGSPEMIEELSKVLHRMLNF